MRRLTNASLNFFKEIVMYHYYRSREGLRRPTHKIKKNQKKTMNLKVSIISILLVGIIAAIIINFFVSHQHETPVKITILEIREKPVKVPVTAKIINYENFPEVNHTVAMNPTPPPKQSHPNKIVKKVSESKASVPKMTINVNPPKNAFPVVQNTTKTHPIDFTNLRICSKEIDELLAKPVLSSDDIQWCANALDPRKGKVIVGKSWGNLKTREERDKFEKLNCNTASTGKNPSCSDAWGDQHIYNWRKNPSVDFTCPVNRNPGNPPAKIQCYRNDLHDQYCVFYQAKINFAKMRKVPHSTGIPSRAFEKDFLAIQCPGQSTAEIPDFKLGHLYSSHGNGGDNSCDVMIPGTTILYSHDNIRNMCHTWNDILNVWLLLWLQDEAEKINQVTFLTVDAMKLYNNFDDQINEFYTEYYNHFKQIKRGLDYNNQQVCFEKLITQSLPSRGFVWENWQQDLPCSFVGPSSLFQRYNLQIRSGFQLLPFQQHQKSTSTTSSGLQVLLIVRSETKNDWGSYRTSRLMLNSDAVISQLQQLSQGTSTTSPFKLIIKDMGKMKSYTEQIKLIAETSIMIGMHGAGIVHSMHMSIGQENCCGVLEIFPKGEFSPVRGYANMIRKMGIHYERIDISEQNSKSQGAIVPLTTVTDKLSVLLTKVTKQHSCILDSVKSNPYLH
jgi:hypothetical protein